MGAVSFEGAKHWAQKTNTFLRYLKCQQGTQDWSIITIRLPPTFFSSCNWKHLTSQRLCRRQLTFVKDIRIPESWRCEFIILTFQAPMNEMIAVIGTQAAHFYKEFLVFMIGAIITKRIYCEFNQNWMNLILFRWQEPSSDSLHQGPRSDVTILLLYLRCDLFCHLVLKLSLSLYVYVG